MKYVTTIITGILILLSAACNKKSTPVSGSDLSISISTICGWCAGGDSLVINARQSVYRYFSSCSPDKAGEQIIPTEPGVWNDLNRLMNKEQLGQLQLNVCNVCADGCDVRVTVKDKNYHHSISYGSNNNEAVAAIRPFLQQLEALRADYEQKYKK